MSERLNEIEQNLGRVGSFLLYKAEMHKKMSQDSKLKMDDRYHESNQRRIEQYTEMAQWVGDAYEDMIRRSSLARDFAKRTRNLITSIAMLDPFPNESAQQRADRIAYLIKEQGFGWMTLAENRDSAEQGGRDDPPSP